MESLVLFRDRQEGQAADFNNLQLYAQQSLDHIVKHGLTDDQRYAMFAITQESSTSVRLAAGLLFLDGRVYNAPQDTVISLTPNLPVLNKKIVALYAYPSVIETQVEERDFLINADNQETEPQPVPMLKLRKAETGKAAGTESVDPQLPALPDNACLIGWVQLSTTGIASITQNLETQLPSVEKNAAAIADLVVWRKQTDPKVGALTSDLAGLQELARNKADINSLFSLMGDVARLKKKANLPSTYSEYGSDFFADTSGLDLTATGLNNGGTPTAKVDLGLKFPDAGRGVFDLALFNPNEPKAYRSADDLVVPVFTSVAVLEVTGDNGEIAIGQYQVQTTVTVSYTEYEWVTKTGWEEGIGYGGQSEYVAPEPMITQAFDYYSWMATGIPTSYEVSGPMTVSQFATALAHGISYLPYGIQ